MIQEEVLSCTGLELTRAIMGVFAEVTEAMNQCMQIKLQEADARTGLPPLSSKQI
jgi:hypothetical protein